MAPRRARLGPSARSHTGKEGSPWDLRGLGPLDAQAHRDPRRASDLPTAPVLSTGRSSLMGLFAGAGANIAMLDGLELGLVLADVIDQGLDVKEREAAIAAIEEGTCGRAEKFAALTMRNFELATSDDAPRSFVPAFTQSCMLCLRNVSPCAKARSLLVETRTPSVCEYPSMEPLESLYLVTNVSNSPSIVESLQKVK
ncbi:hypothetical protein BD414DRAFT_486448 [Trametes punicea]|nr:hypothetical protein BD414DRAFT_486448 [Trametes punicea]